MTGVAPGTQHAPGFLHAPGSLHTPGFPHAPGILQWYTGYVYRVKKERTVLLQGGSASNAAGLDRV